MRKLVLGLGLGLALLGSVSSTTSNKSSEKNNYESNACRYGQCYGTAKSTGNRCRACVSNSGDYYCGWHD